MNKSYDVIVAKEFTTKNNGKEEKRTVWNRVGRAWPSQSGESLSFELYLLPNMRYVIQLKEKEQTQNKPEETPF